MAAKVQAHMGADPGLFLFLEKIQKSALNFAVILFIYYWGYGKRG